MYCNCILKASPAGDSYSTGRACFFEACSKVITSGIVTAFLPEKVAQAAGNIKSGTAGTDGTQGTT